MHGKRGYWGLAGSLLMACALGLAPGAVRAAAVPVTATAAAISHDGQYLAWIAPHASGARLMLASPSGRDAHPVRLSARCPVVDLRWDPNWNRLAAITTCAGDVNAGTPAESALWLVDVHAHKAPARVAGFAGSAWHLRWMPGRDQWLFLRARTASAAAATTPLGAKIPSVSAALVTLPVTGGAPKAISPAGWSVSGFDWLAATDQVVYVARQAAPAGSGAVLYLQDAKVGATARPLVRAAALAGEHGPLRISNPRWASGRGMILFLASSRARTWLAGVPARGGTATDLSAQIRGTPVWFRALGRGQLLLTTVQDGVSQLATYGFAHGHLRPMAGLFSLPGRWGDGDRAGAVSLSGPLVSRAGRILALVQVSPSGAGRLRAGHAMTMPPPVVSVPKPAGS